MADKRNLTLATNKKAYVYYMVMQCCLKSARGNLELFKRGAFDGKILNDARHLIYSAFYNLPLSYHTELSKLAIMLNRIEDMDEARKAMSVSRGGMVMKMANASIQNAVMKALTYTESEIEKWATLKKSNGTW